MTERITIFGGSGFVGRAITREAIRQGYEVTIACRHPERSRDLKVEGARLMRADIIDGKGIDEAVAGADCVINLVGILFERGRSTFEATHLHGTEKIIAACKTHGIGRYLHMSAMGAGDNPASAYACTKGEAEERVQASKLTWTIFRPSIIFGAGDNFFRKFEKMSRIGPVVPVISGETRFQPVWVEDVARAFVMSIGNKKAQNKCFELAGPQIYTFAGLIEMLMSTLGRKRLLVPVPDIAARLMALFMQFLPTPPLTPDQLAMLRRDNIAKGTPFPKLFGNASPVEEILPTYIFGNRVGKLQQSFDSYRKHYRKGSGSSD